MKASPSRHLSNTNLSRPISMVGSGGGRLAAALRSQRSSESDSLRRNKSGITVRTVKTTKSQKKVTFGGVINIAWVR